MTSAAPLPLNPLHDFASKLRQPALLPRVMDYVAWAREVRAARGAGEAPPPMPAWAPLSINLDLTTACNYACDHCIDWDLLNSGVSFKDKALEASLTEMAGRGLKSVILIGGGEPTVHPAFSRMVRHLKDLLLEVAIVSNGGRNDRILEIVDRLDANDWIRLSLDAGTDATFQTMHRPKKPITLDAICAWIPRIKAKNPLPRVGFSFLIAWPGAEREAGAPVIENIDEIPLAAKRARDAGFDYVSFKPFLTRTPEGAEVMTPGGAAETDSTAARARLEAILRRIRSRVEEAKAFATSSFSVLESTNLRALESGRVGDLARQPTTCHMQALRQVLTPMGLWNCPAHRGVEKAKIAGKDAFATPEDAQRTAQDVAAILGRFDASHECREIACLYNGANWWIENAIDDGVDAASTAASAEREDWFL